MLELSRLLLHSSRDRLSQKSLFKEATCDFKLLHGITTRTVMSCAMQSTARDGNSAVKMFALYSIYKGKAALSAGPRLPTFSKLKSGGYKVERRGAIMLTLWPAIGERKYDWDKRQVFALSATEVGSLISLGSKDSWEFFHDPSMLSSNAGQVRKSLSIKAHADGSGYFISLSVVNRHEFGEDNADLLNELCEGINKISVREGPKFEGKHIRFIYNIDDEIENEEDLPKTLPEGSTTKESRAFEKLHADHRQVHSIVLASITNEIQKQYERIDDVGSIMLRMQQVYAVLDRHLRYVAMKAFFGVKMIEGSSVQSDGVMMLSIVEKLKDLHADLEKEMYIDVVL
ncbi:UNVERIFIED_CONTAM: Single-stranded DNA-binding protein WHY2, mitochondrial [Sesamum latifolium]|uniref:Single-stranded DNA-binding protein WHY2, mitochondrial n=1 Tax=Sesamum latifolium TaxID=2727402 RepID=A0AAW2TBF6_9LAMI